ncbi:MAG: DUF4382 domain-containing protein [Cyanothece sp. SIO1E1]|nr:DUF4382 domain-containing protein [Cyanothece sp. SIO1E1]
MKTPTIAIASSIFLPGLLLWGCDALEISNSLQSSSTENTPSPQTGQGQLELYANGEDFVRQGFVSKDGWQINFDHVYVNLTEISAYQTDPAFDPDTNTKPQASIQASWQQAQTIDLAAGDEQAQPILIDVIPASAGHYNALAWNMKPAADGAAQGQTLMFVGRAQKTAQTIDFTLKIDREFAYLCGEFVGDERKGILSPKGIADLELTFHFDHIFGDSDVPANQAPNADALGFEPLAALASDATLEVNMTMLKEKLTPADYSLLEKNISGLGHVGEGHCRARQTL